MRRGRLHLSASAQLAVLASALSSWVEGSAQLRSYAVSNLASNVDEAPLEEYGAQDGEPPAGHWIWEWIKRKGKPLDDAERAAIGALDVATSFVILHLFRSRPLLPFLMSPLIASFPLPLLHRGTPKAIEWSRVLTATFILSLIHEMERVTVVGIVRAWRQNMRSRTRASLGRVTVQGREPKRLSISDETSQEQDECMICSEVGIDMSMAQAADGTSNTVPHDLLSSLGPLEAFCTNAPDKHIAHRACFLRWHAVYQQQRHTLGPYLVQVLNAASEGRSSNHDCARAQTILKAGGFGYLLPTHTTPVGAQNAPSLPILTLHESKPPKTIDSTISRNLATLHTSSPPCPGCRSAVDLQFISHPIISKALDTVPPTFSQAIQHFVTTWQKDWVDVVSGRTIILRLLTNISFLLALISMIRTRSKIPAKA